MQTLKPILSAHPFLRSLPPAYLAVLAACAEVREFARGEVIFREGEVADQFYLIEKGKVVLETHAGSGEHLIVQELSPLDVLGWSWLFPPHAWHFQARVVEPARMLSFRATHLLATCERDHAFGYDIMKRLAQVLIRRLQATQKQFVELHNDRASA